MPSYRMIKDPLAVLDYAFVWCAKNGTNVVGDGWLGGATIISSTWTVTGPDDTLIVDADVIAPFLTDEGGVVSEDTVTRVFLSGGTIFSDQRYRVDNVITTSDSKTESRSISFQILDR